VKDRDWKAECLKYKTPRLTAEQRKARVQDKIKAFKAGHDAAMEDEE